MINTKKYYGNIFGTAIAQCGDMKEEKNKIKERILIAGNAIIHYPLASGKRMYFNKPIYSTMSKSNTANSFVISNLDDLEKFVQGLPKAKAVKGKKVAQAIVTDVESFDSSKLVALQEAIYLSGANVQLFLQGNVGPYSALLLSRRFKRVGFEGRNINLSIPASVSNEERATLTDKIAQYANSEAVDKVKTLISQGASITMGTAKELGLIDQVVDLAKRRGQSKSTTVQVASTETTSSVDSKAAS